MSEQFKRLQAALAEKELIGFKRRKDGRTPTIERASSAKGVKPDNTLNSRQSGAED